MEPPIHAEIYLSGGAITLIFIGVGTRAVTSLLSLSGNPGNILVPPEITILFNLNIDENKLITNLFSHRYHIS